MFLCDGAKIGLSRAVGLTICVLMHEINISVVVADADFLFLLLGLSLKSTLLILIAFAKCNLNSTNRVLLLFTGHNVCAFF